MLRDCIVLCDHRRRGLWFHRRLALSASRFGIAAALARDGRVRQADAPGLISLFHALGGD